MQPLKIDISGVRGIIGETLVPEMIINFACAFGTYLKGGKVGVGCDTRASREMVKSAVLSGLISTGCDIVDLGICPTPIIQYTAKHLGLKGAIAITASHNNSNWNALKFIKADGTFLNFYEGEELLDIYHQGEFKKAAWDNLGRVTKNAAAIDLYMDKLCKYLDAGRIRRKRLKVAIDNCNGAGGEAAGIFMKKLGCRLVMINDEITGVFSHDPEPTSANMEQLSSIIKPVKADVGFMLDADVDRVAICTEQGKPLSEEYTFALLADYILSKRRGPVVTNFSTSRMIDDIAKKYGVKLIRTKIGQAYIIEEMMDEGGVISGEGSGSVAVGDFQYASDGFLAMGLILQMLSEKKRKISELSAALPKYHMVKKKITCPPDIIYSVIDRAKRHYKDGDVDLADGVKVEWKDSWLHIRASNTEPLIRVLAESTSKEKAEELCGAAVANIKAEM
ncbi:MAG: phosphoglucosamine mutase [Candidatus Omnitrophica bacterium]|nr:phosphoglucosamine mutase [Candidatus Omnitrophota bacterium]